MLAQEDYLGDGWYYGTRGFGYVEGMRSQFSTSRLVSCSFGFGYSFSVLGVFPGLFYDRYIFGLSLSEEVSRVEFLVSEPWSVAINTQEAGGHFKVSQPQIKQIS